jgi:putative ABC transport system ATP-binding protein
VIQLKGVGRRYDMGEASITALHDVELGIARGEYLAITGPSGSGKSTLMNILGCLDRPTTGQYHLDGRDVAGLSDDELAKVRNQDIGFVFQSFHLLAKLSALDNVALPLMYRGVAPQDRAQRAAQALAQVGLESRLGHKPNELSGGQRQRVAVARAMVGRPAILLADEPTGNLDSETTGEILSLLETLHQGGQTVIVVTHEPEVAQRCRRRVRMQDGRIVGDSASRLVDRPQKQRPRGGTPFN